MTGSESKNTSRGSTNAEADSLPSKELAALIRERYTRDNWSGLTYDEAMQVAATLDGPAPETDPLPRRASDQ